MLKVGIESSVYFDAKNYENGLKEMSKHGYNCVDYLMAGEPIDSYSDEDFLKYLKDFRKTADKLGIEVFQAHGNYGNAFNNEPFGINDFLIRQLLACKELGCKYLVMHPYTDGYILNADSHDEIYRKNKEFFEMLLPYAKEYGVTLCLENLPFRWFEMCRVTAIKKLIKDIDDENLKACFDTGHANVLHEDIYKSIKLLGEDLKVLHVHDNFGGADDRHYLPFRGNIDWDAFILALKEIKYNGCFSLETGIAIKTPEPIRDDLRRGVYRIAKYFAEKIQ